MATLATFFRRSDFFTADRSTPIEAVDPYQLRSLAGDNIYFFSKRIDNSRLVRQTDPRTRTDCWSTIATACLLAVMIGAAVSPHIGVILTGYRMERLKAERLELFEKRRGLEIEEARMLSPGRLDELANKHQLTAPRSGQEVHLQPRDSSFALNINPAHAMAR